MKETVTVKTTKGLYGEDVKTTTVREYAPEELPFKPLPPIPKWLPTYESMTVGVLAMTLVLYLGRWLFVGWAL